MPIRKSKDPQRNLPWCCELNWTDAFGEKHRETKWFRTEGEAKDHEADHKKLIKDRLKFAKKNTGTIRNAVELWLKDCERRVRTGQGKQRMVESTLDNYRRFARLYVLPDLGPVSLIDPLVVVKCQDCLNELPAKSAAKSAAIVLVQAFRVAKQRRMIPLYPFVGPDKLQYAEPDEEMTILEIPEIGRLLEAAAIRHYDERALTVATRSAALRMMCLMGGMRRGEVCGLQWPSVHWDDGTVHIWQQQTEDEGLVNRTKTDAGTRVVKMPRQVREALTELWEMQGKPTTGYVLRTVMALRYMESSGATILPLPCAAAGWLSKIQNARCMACVVRVTCCLAVASQNAGCMTCGILTSR
jgi:integrase